MIAVNAFLDSINQRYLNVSTAYEKNFWLTYMGDETIKDAFATTHSERDAFKADQSLLKQTRQWLADPTVQSDPILIQRLKYRERYFALQAFPPEAQGIKQEINAREDQVKTQMARLDSGYIDPHSGEFKQKTRSGMGMIMATNDDETIRKAAFAGKEESTGAFVDDLIGLINKKNTFAKIMGYDNFYEYKAQTEEQMTAQAIWDIFDELSITLKQKNKDIRALEQTMPHIRQPRNTSYMISGDSIKENDPYFPLETMLRKRGQSFTARGIRFRHASVNLDLLERYGKHNNGFCHTINPAYYANETRKPTTINFTCTAIINQPGSGRTTGNTLFHEGGHAAHFANMDCKDIILNTEYIPQSVARAETQSMFLDDMYDSIDRKMRYAETLDGKQYPFSLYEKNVHTLHPLEGRQMLSIAAVVKFEQILYTTPADQLTPAFVMQIAKDLSVSFFDHETPTLRLLTIPHIYSRSSSCYYHGYGMATLAVEQRKKYFTDRDGYLIDNPAIGPEMAVGRALGSSLSPQDLRKKVLGSELSPQAYLDTIMQTPEQKIAAAQQRIKKCNEKHGEKPASTVSLDARLAVVEANTEICSTDGGFDTFDNQRRKFLLEKNQK